MNNYRISTNNLIPTNEKLDDGTSAEFIAINRLNSKKGVYKKNGNIIRITNEDIREKLASQFFKFLDIPCAEIDLTYDSSSKTNGCFSYYIINENEKLIMPKDRIYRDTKFTNLTEYFENYYNTNKNMVNLSDEDILVIKKNLAQTIFMDCILDHYDRKEANMRLVCDAKTDEYLRPSACYDYGLAFNKNSYNKNGPFKLLSNEEVMKQLFENYFDDIKDLYNLTQEKLTPENISSFFDQEYIFDNFSKDEIKEIQNNLNSRVAQSKQMFDLVNDKEKNSTALVNYKPNIFQKIINALKARFPKEKPIAEPEPELAKEKPEARDFKKEVKYPVNTSTILENIHTQEEQSINLDEKAK